jgi:hypothetical protein
MEQSTASAPVKATSTPILSENDKPKLMALPILPATALAPTEDRPKASGNPPFPAKFKAIMSDVRLPYDSAPPKRLAATEGAPFMAVSVFSAPLPKRNVLIEFPREKLAKGFDESEESLPVARLYDVSTSPPMLYSLACWAIQAPNV